MRRRFLEPGVLLLSFVLSSFLILFLAFVAEPWVAPAQGADAPLLPTVILISLDGTRPADVTPETLPTLAALARKGAVAERLIPVMPASTFPSHVSLVTGVSPQRHGIVNNIFVDPERGTFKKKDIPTWIEVEPLWSILDRAGIVSAAYHWVGSEGPWRGRGPRHWIPFSSRTREMKKVEQMLAWLDLEDPAERPRFISSWFHGADHVAHDHGPGHEAVRESLLAQDPAIDALYQGLEERGLLASTTLIFVSDHGMAVATSRLNLGRELSKAKLPGRVYGIGGFATIDLGPAARTRPEAAEDVVARARALGLEAHVRSAAPASLPVHNPRFGDVVVVAEVGTAIVYSGLDIVGFHGYDPEAVEMSALFIALGRGVKPGARLPAQRALDIAPTVLALLGVPVPDWMEGRPIRDIVPGEAESATIPASPIMHARRHHGAITTPP